MWERTEPDILNALPDSLLEGHVWKGSKCQPQQIRMHVSSSAQHVTESLLHDAQLCASWTEAGTFRGRCVLGAKQREVEHEITSVYHSPPLHYLCVSVDLAATGGVLAWFSKQIKVVRVD